MSKSSRSAGYGSNPARRMSQPAHGSVPSLDRRRTSEVVGGTRGADPLPPEGSASGGGGKEYGAPVQHEDKGPRKSRATKDIPDGPSYDPETYNPDGSVRTMHRLPNFVEAYEQAKNANYVRPREIPDKDKQLSIKEIFGHT